MRFILAFACASLVAATGVGQDMPLHEILKPGEGWQDFVGTAPECLSRKCPYEVVPGTQSVRKDGKTSTISVTEPTCTAVALDGSTLLVGDAAGGYLWAFRIEKDGSIGTGDRYCRLKLRKREVRSETSALTVDKSQRSYAAMSDGIQIFDPTGRLCGVITAPAGKIDVLAFQGNKLFAKVKDKLFVREMLAEGME